LLRPGTDEHDYSYRMKHAREWLTEGDKVKATIWFRGREMTHRELGARILKSSKKARADISEARCAPAWRATRCLILGPRQGGDQTDRPPQPWPGGQNRRRHYASFRQFRQRQQPCRLPPPPATVWLHQSRRLRRTRIKWLIRNRAGPQDRTRSGHLKSEI
jgi:translation initiation factor IF-3